MLESLPLAGLALCFFTPPVAAQIGSVVRAQKINEVIGGLVGPVSRLGYSLAAIGDLNGDGVGDLVAGLPLDNADGHDRGAVLVLFLNADGTVAGQQKIGENVGGFTGNLGRRSAFGQSMANLGDVNGDGFVDLSAGAFGPGGHRWVLFLDANQEVIGTAILQITEVFGAIGDLDGDGIAECASEGFVVRFLASDGLLRKKLLIHPGRNGMPLDPLTRSLGYLSLAALGDLDGDGTLELAVGDLNDTQSGGAIWILSLARTPAQNGSGINPIVYKELDEPVVGGTWKAVLDCSGHASGLAAIFGFERPLSGVVLPAGELLVDPASRRLSQLFAPHSGGLRAFSAAVPRDISLVDLQICSQERVAARQA